MRRWDLLVLEDPKSALPPYDAVLLLSSSASQDVELISALQPLVGAISNDAMRQANKSVDTYKNSVPDAAAFLRTLLNK